MDKNCIVCGRQFRTTMYYIKHGWGNTCSLKCAGTLREKKKIKRYTCNTCKKEFLAYEKNRKYCSRGCFGISCHGKIVSKETRQKLHKANFKGNNIIGAGGYIHIYMPEHPFANRNYVLEHRLVMERHIGRVLNSSEVVHHIDKNVTNNNINNLLLFPNSGAHTRYHHMIRRNE